MFVGLSSSSILNVVYEAYEKVESVCTVVSDIYQSAVGSLLVDAVKDNVVEFGGWFVGKEIGEIVVGRSLETVGGIIGHVGGVALVIASGYGTYRGGDALMKYFGEKNSIRNNIILSAVAVGVAGVASYYVPEYLEGVGSEIGKNVGVFTGNLACGILGAFAGIKLFGSSEELFTDNPSESYVTKSLACLVAGQVLPVPKLPLHLDFLVELGRDSLTFNAESIAEVISLSCKGKVLEKILPGKIKMIDLTGKEVKKMCVDKVISLTLDHGGEFVKDKSYRSYIKPSLVQAVKDCFFNRSGRYKKEIEELSDTLKPYYSKILKNLAKLYPMFEKSTQTSLEYLIEKIQAPEFLVDQLILGLNGYLKMVSNDKELLSIQQEMIELVKNEKNIINFSHELEKKRDEWDVKVLNKIKQEVTLQNGFIKSYKFFNLMKKSSSYIEFLSEFKKNVENFNPLTELSLHNFWKARKSVHQFQDYKRISSQALETYRFDLVEKIYELVDKNMDDKVFLMISEKAIQEINKFEKHVIGFHLSGSQHKKQIEVLLSIHMKKVLTFSILNSFANGGMLSSCGEKEMKGFYKNITGQFLNYYCRINPLLSNSFAHFGFQMLGKQIDGSSLTY